MIENIEYLLKVLSISIFTIYVNYRILNKKAKKKVIIFIFVFLVNIIAMNLEKQTNQTISIIFLDMLLATIFSIFEDKNYGHSLLVTTISLAINYILYMISIAISYAIFRFSFANSEHVILLFIILIYGLSTYMLFRTKKLRKGITFIKNKENDEYLGVLILNISSTIIFAFSILNNIEITVEKSVFIYIIIFIVIMFMTIEKSLQLYYKQKMLIKDLEETKAELEEKKKEVEELEKENMNFSKVSHSIAHKQNSLEFKLNELSMKSEISSEIGNRIDKLGKELSKETVSVIEKTGVEEIDDMLKYMQAECVKNKIDFQLQISGNIYTMINHYIDKEELEILLADHIKNAIIAIGYGDNINKSILVRLGKLDGYYGLYIYDSGIEFEIETLYKLGKIPATTHKDNGGTGMGFMNTFDTLRKHKASFVIEEYGKPVKNNFTKALKFIFNGKNEFKIYSYRNEEIEKENKENDLVVEKLNI